MIESKQILAAVANLEIFGRVEEFLLENAEAEMKQVRDGTAALALAMRRRFDLILTEFPLPRLNMARFLERLRTPDSTSRSSSVVVMAGSLDRSELERLSPDCRRGVDICTSSRQTLRAVAESLDLSDRLAQELKVWVSATTESSSGVHIWRTRNISPSGMLLRTDQLLPVGSVLPISIEIPEDERLVHGRAEVVRHAEPESDRYGELGMRFLQLFGDGGERLDDFVHTELAFKRFRARYRL